MIKGDLVLAMDYEKDRKTPRRVYSYRDGLGRWFLVRSGPGFSNTYAVQEYDDAGLARLQALESPGATAAYETGGGK